MSFDPEAFLKSLRRALPSDPDYLTLTFEDYLKQKDLWEKLKDRVNKKYEKFDGEVTYLRSEYNEEMRRRREAAKAVQPLFEKDKEPEEEDPEAKRLAHISEFGH